MSKQLKAAWLTVAEIVDARRHDCFGTTPYLCFVVKDLRAKGHLSKKVAQHMIERIALDLSARFNAPVSAEDCHVAYGSETLDRADGTNPDDDMGFDEQTAARVLAALMFAHEAA